MDTHRLCGGRICWMRVFVAVATIIVIFTLGYAVGEADGRGVWDERYGAHKYHMMGEMYRSEYAGGCPWMAEKYVPMMVPAEGGTDEDATIGTDGLSEGEPVLQ